MSSNQHESIRNHLISEIGCLRARVKIFGTDPSRGTSILRTVTAVGGLVCDACGVAIAKAAVAVAVDFFYTTHLRVPRRDRPGWACAPCASRATPARLKPTLLGDGLWRPYPTVDTPSPCEGCGQLLALRPNRKRARVTCSSACATRTTPSHRGSRASTSVSQCEQCGGHMPNARTVRKYCSSPCRQRAYRQRRSRHESGRPQYLRGTSDELRG